MPFGIIEHGDNTHTSVFNLGFSLEATLLEKTTVWVNGNWEQTVLKFQEHAFQNAVAKILVLVFSPFLFLGLVENVSNVLLHHLLVIARHYILSMWIKEPHT